MALSVLDKIKKAEDARIKALADRKSEQTSAIRTLYAGTWFRSRLEARCAAMFDKLGWPWDYEPVDLPGYIPDFKVGRLLVECKPRLSTDMVCPTCLSLGQVSTRTGRQFRWCGHGPAIEHWAASAYTKAKSAIVQSDVRPQPPLVILGSDLFPASANNDVLAWGYAIGPTYPEHVGFGHCRSCRGPCLYIVEHPITANEFGRDCDLCGERNCVETLAPGAPGIVSLWREAGNLTQWQPSPSAGDAETRKNNEHTPFITSGLYTLEVETLYERDTKKGPCVFVVFRVLTSDKTGTEDPSPVGSSCCVIFNSTTAGFDERLRGFLSELLGQDPDRIDAAYEKMIGIDNPGRGLQVRCRAEPAGQYLNFRWEHVPGQSIP